jgi:hypothetical protein
MKGVDVDDSQEAMPAYSGDVETEVKELLGLFDLPAFARRGQDLELTVRRMHARCRTARTMLLDMVHMRLRQWSSAAVGPDDWPGVFTGSIEPIWLLSEAEPAPWASSRAPHRRRLSIGRDLAAAVTRFNRRWLKALDRLNLEPANLVIEQYNRYYVLEKECVMGSPRLAARHFSPVPQFTRTMLLEHHPTLPVPELLDRPAGIDRT